MFSIRHRDVHKYTTIVMNSPISIMGMIIIIKLRMISERFLACDFKLQPFYSHNAMCCNINVPDHVTFLNKVTYSGNLVQTEVPIERKPNQITFG